MVAHRRRPKPNEGNISSSSMKGLEGTSAQNYPVNIKCSNDSGHTSKRSWRSRYSQTHKGSLKIVPDYPQNADPKVGEDGLEMGLTHSARSMFLKLVQLLLNYLFPKALPDYEAETLNTLHASIVNKYSSCSGVLLITMLCTMHPKFL